MENVKVVEKETSDMIVQIQYLVITSQTEYEDAADYLRRVKEQQNKVEESFNPIITKAHQAHKEAIGQRDKHLVPLKDAEKRIKFLMGDYQGEKERIAKIEAERLVKIAEAEAEKERKRLQAIKERAEATGKTEKAQMVAEQIENITVEAVVVAPDIQTPRGVSYSAKYRGEVIEFKILPDEYKIVNQSALDRVLQATKGAIQIPGVKINVEKILSSRG